MKKTNYSAKREAIYNAIISTKSHPCAKTVYDKLKADMPDLSLGTVYRNIALFKEQGLISYVANVDGEERIDGDTSSHSHFVCDCCKRIFDLPMIEDTDTEKSLLKDGFEISSKNVVFHGKCSECCSK